MTGDLRPRPPGVGTLLAHLGVPQAEVLGEGGESVVYALDRERVVRVLRVASVDALTSRKQLLDTLDTAPLPFAVPEILDIGEHEGTTFALERRLPGVDLERALSRLEGERRTRALTGFVEGAGALRSVPFERPWFGELLGELPLRRPTWPGFLVDRIRHCLHRSLPDLRADLSDADACIRGFEEETDRLADVRAPGLAHGDWCAWNVLVDDDGRLTAALDFSVLTLAGDWRMDVACAVIYLEMVPTATPADRDLVAAVALDRFGPEVQELTDVYRWYFSLFFSFTKTDEPRLYRWCIESLEGLTPRQGL